MKVNRSREDQVAASVHSSREKVLKGAKKIAESGQSRSEAPVRTGDSAKNGFSVPFSRTELSDTVRTLINILDRNSPRQQAVLSLLQLTRELPVNEDGSLRDSSDSRLLQTILKHWRERFGDDLGLEGRRRLELIEKQLSSVREDGYCLFSTEAGQDGFRFRLSVEERENRVLDECHSSLLVLDMELKELGLIRSRLGGEEGQLECRISCESGSTLRRLRKAFPVLRKRLAPFRIKELSLGKFHSNRGIKEHTAGGGVGSAEGKKKGIRLWG